jgi:hypothetical protein
MRRKSILIVATTAVVVALATAPTGTAEPVADPDRNTAKVETAVEPPVVAADERGTLLGDGWQSSGDRLWTTTGDGSGFHVLVAEAKTGYSWRTAATLVKPGVDADTWIGNACVTGSGTKAVVVYAPRTFTNDEKLFARGGFTAVVDLVTGTVTDVPVRTTLAYYNPGCGLGEEVALTQAADLDLGMTGLRTVEANTGKVSDRTEVAGQFTSAIPMGNGFAVAGGTGVLKIGRDGEKERIAKTAGVPFHLKADRDGGIVFMAAESDSVVNAQRSTGVRGKTSLLAKGATGEVGLTASGGRVFITGGAKLEALPPVVTKLDIPAGSEVSTTAEAAVTEVVPTKSPVQVESQPWNIKVKSLKTGRDMGFGVDPADVLKPREVEPERTCAVARNDVQTQVLQPKPKQVEWAVNMAVKNHLDVLRPAGWGGHQGGYRPQDMFPQRAMAYANGGTVPAQIMLGIIGQESNMWQASRHTLPGETGNPLIGNYYGVDVYNFDDSDDWNVDFVKADCGYGVTQMTDGMRTAGRTRPGEVALPQDKQLAIGTDYAANIAAGLALLQDKWNQVQAAGMRLNNNDVTSIENWFFAAWAYNSGYHPPGEPNTNGAHGLGWGNNPANPQYDPNREPFGEDPYDFARPQFWPYPEKVMGFAANPPWGLEDENTEVPFFRPANWDGGDGLVTTPGTGAYNRHHVKPDRFLFCTSANQCVPGGLFTPTDPDVDDDPLRDTGPCAHQNAAGQYDLRCWWHDPATWKPGCAQTCGYEFIRYDWPTYSQEPANGLSYIPQCDAQGPVSTRTLVIDHTAPTRRPFCTQMTSAGVMAFRYDKPAAWMDLHQLGSGFGGHTWISHTKQSTVTELKAVTTADWTLNQKMRTRAGVWAYIPAHGLDKTTAAVYEVQTALGKQTVTKNQRNYRGQWMLLGKFDFDNIPKVTLSTLTGDGTTGAIVAFDAIAFSPEDGFQQSTDYITRFVHYLNQYCLTALTTTYPAPVVHRSCTGNFSDDWLVRHVPNTNTNDRKEFRIIQRATGLCLATKFDAVNNRYTAEARQCGPNPYTDLEALWGNGTELNRPQTSLVCNIYVKPSCLFPEGLNPAEGTPVVLTNLRNGIEEAYTF